MIINNIANNIIKHLVYIVLINNTLDTLNLKVLIYFINSNQNNIYKNLFTKKKNEDAI